MRVCESELSVKIQKYDAKIKVSLTAATRLHDKMFNSLIYGATSFFDATPTGRILNRFSKDMDESRQYSMEIDLQFFSVDVKLPFTAEVFLQNMITCLGFLVVIVSVFPLFLVSALNSLGFHTKLFSGVCCSTFHHFYRVCVLFPCRNQKVSLS